MTPQQQQEAQKKAARAFVARWQAAEGSEQQKAAKFWLELYADALGVANPTRLLDFERRVRGRRIDVFHEDVGALIEHKSRGVDLDAAEPRGKEKSGTLRMVTPSEALVRKCRANLEAGLRPLIVTIAESRAGLESIAKGFDIDGRIDVIEAEQFIATNLFEWGRFQNRFTKEALMKIVNRYNEIVAEYETDPSLKIEM